MAALHGVAQIKQTEKAVEISKGGGAVTRTVLLSQKKTHRRWIFMIDPELGLPSCLCGCGVEKCIH